MAISDSSKLKEFADISSKFDENGVLFSKKVKRLWEKEKLLVTSNFSFSHSVFKRPVRQTSENKGLFGKGLIKNTVKMEKLLIMSIFFFLLQECSARYERQIS